MSTIRERLLDALSQHLQVPADTVAGWLSSPKRPEHGDVALPCFPLLKVDGGRFGKNPAEIAAKIRDEMSCPPGVGEAVAMGPFLNFRFDRGVYAEEVLGRVLAEREAYGQSSFGDGKPVVVDFSSPNIAKPFHVGHLRSTLIGSALTRLFRFRGHPVIGINHLGDWGTQFGLVSVGCDMWGRPPADHPDPVQALVEVYQRASREAKEDPSIEEKARAWFRSLEDGDAKAREFWEYAREVSLNEFKRIYERIGVQFDSFNGESFYNDKMEPVLDELRESGVGADSEGSFGVVLDEPLGFAMLQKADGATLYLTRDLAAIDYRWRTYAFEQALYVVGAPQSLHFSRCERSYRSLANRTRNDSTMCHSATWRE